MEAACSLVGVDAPPTSWRGSTGSAPSRACGSGDQWFASRSPGGSGSGSRFCSGGTRDGGGGTGRDRKGSARVEAWRGGGGGFVVLWGGEEGRGRRDGS